jgi:glycosyltransferase involved in cell wall biosynthesis
MKFSIIIPTYSRLELLDKALLSVSHQTYKDYEVLVVNDNPAEQQHVEDIVAKFGQTKAFHHHKSLGGNAARNSGIKHSTGGLIAFLDDDDTWLPEKLSRHYHEHQKDNNIGLVYSDCLYVYDKASIPDVRYSAELPVNIIEAMGKGAFCPATSSIVTIKRECVDDCGLFDENLPSFQDWDYWFRIAHEFKFAHIPEVLVHFRQHLGDRTSQNENKRRNGLQQITSKWAQEIDVNQFTKTSLSSIYYKNARNALLAGKKMTAFKNSLKLFDAKVLGLRSIKGFIKLCLSILKA